MFYCIKCKKIHDDSEAQSIFSTGYKRQDGIDYHLGKCHSSSTEALDCGNEARFQEISSLD